MTESGASIQNISDPAWRFEPAPHLAITVLLYASTFKMVEDLLAINTHRR